jgi:hypothetical protein
MEKQANTLIKEGFLLMKELVPLTEILVLPRKTPESA